MQTWQSRGDSSQAWWVRQCDIEVKVETKSTKFRTVPPGSQVITHSGAGMAGDERLENGYKRDDEDQGWRGKTERYHTTGSYSTPQSKKRRNREDDGEGRWRSRIHNFLCIVVVAVFLVSLGEGKIDWSNYKRIKRPPLEDCESQVSKHFCVTGELRGLEQTFPLNGVHAYHL